jgi:hypothetical protein
VGCPGVVRVAAVGVYLSSVILRVPGRLADRVRDAREPVMEPIYEHVAGIDVGKEEVAVTISPSGAVLLK